jgi:signal transduction histidine kinase/DNA-binding response OmpR family regulator
MTSRTPVPGVHEPKTLLLVEDNPTTRKMFKVALQSEGYSIVEAATGAAALEAMTQHAVDLILQDWILPDIGGIELAQALRQLPGGRKRPIVAMSGFHRMVEELRGRPGAFDTVLLKPVELSLLFRTVAHYLDAGGPAEESGPVGVLTSHDAQTPTDPNDSDVQLRRGANVSSELLERSAMQAAQLSILGGIADALARSTDAERVLGDALASCLDAGGITKGALFRTARDGSLEPAHTIGFSAAELAPLATLFGHPQLLQQLERGAVLLGSALPAALLASADVRVLVIVPCLADGRTTGALLLGSDQPNVVQLDLLSFGRAMATYVSQALRLSDSFAALQESAAASRQLFSSLDVDQTIRTLAEVATVRLADLCQILLVESDGSTGARTILHVDADVTARLQGLCEAHGGADRPAFLQAVIEAGRSELVPELTPELIAEAGEPYATIMRSIGARSRIIVPLCGHDHVLGVAMFCSAQTYAYNARDLSLVDDLASRAALAIENARLFATVSAANKLKDEFLATVSHELRTPLNSILGWAQMLRGDRLPAAKRTQALAVIERNALLQAGLVEDLLDVSQLVAGKLTIELSPVDLTSVINAAIEAVQPSLNAKCLTLESSTPKNSDASASIIGDARRLQQVVWNLLTNAIKFTPSDGHLRVELDCEVDDDPVVVRVIDDGLGMAPEFLPLAFQRFKQADGRISRKYGGLGIGLAICHDIVALHNGTITAHSDGLGRGATFRVALPRDPRNKAVSGRSAQVGGTTPRSKHARDAWSHLRQLKVLIVDDEPDARELLFELMLQVGANPCVATSCESALAAIHDEQPDVLLSDIGMPGEDGYSLIRRVRALTDAAGGAIPAAALTGHVRPEDRVAALSAGFQMHIGKPINMAELLEVVSNLARMSSLLKSRRSIVGVG